MIARKIKPEELKRTEEIASVSFDFSYGYEKSAAELYMQYTEDPDSRSAKTCLERFAAFEDDDKTMMSCFSLNPYYVNFDGHTVSMSGVGGVATLPQFRRRGGIRACFEQALPYLYENGTAFSYLYPFSTAYYRKFGYEMCCKKQQYEVLLQHIPLYSLKGKSYLLDVSTASMGAEDIPHIYNELQKKYNMMVVKEADEFSYIPNSNPYKHQEYTYVYRNENQEPLACMTLCTERNDPDNRHLNCSQFFYLNDEGLKGLLALAKSFASDFRSIRFALPEGYALEQILPEWIMSAVTCELVPYGMVRVINAKQVLTNASYLGSGKISIRLSDHFIEENNRTFHVSFENGACTSVTEDDGEADISMHINSFSAMITGGYTAEAMSLFGDVVLHNPNAPVGQIFRKKNVYIATAF